MGRAVETLQYLLDQAEERCNRLEKENGELREAILDLISHINQNKRKIEE